MNCFDNFVSTLLQFLCTNHLKSMINKISPNASKIRRMAEELLKKGNSVSSLPVGPELDQSPALLQSEIQRLLYELEVHRTELKMQNELFLKNKLLQEVLNAVPDIILILNKDRQIVFTNYTVTSLLEKDNVTEILGMRPGECISYLDYI